MKKTLLGLMATALLFSACNKNDNDGDGPAQDNWQLSKIMMESDTIGLVYNADGTVKMAKEYGGSGTDRYEDSVAINWQDGKLLKFSYYEDGVAQPDYSFAYNGAQITKVQHYEPGENGYEAGGYDSIKYENGKIKEIHFINSDGVRSHAYVLTWSGDNVAKSAYSAYNFDGTGNLTPVSETTYEYTDKPGMSKVIRGDLFFWLYDQNPFDLSANAIAKAVEKNLTDNSTSTSTYTFTFENERLVSLKEVEDGETFEAKFEYVEVQ